MYSFGYESVSYAVSGRHTHVDVSSYLSVSVIKAETKQN